MTFLLFLVACSVPEEKATQREITNIDTNSNESFYEYTGGWPIGECHNDIHGDALEVGRVAPQFELLDQYGDTVKLHDFCHMAVLVVTGAAWCGPCQALRSELSILHERYYDRGLMILYLLGETESGGEPAQADLEKWADGHPYAVLADPGWGVTNQGYASGGIPASNLLTLGGKVVFLDEHLSLRDVEALIRIEQNLPTYY